MKLKVFVIALLCALPLQARMLDVMIFTGMSEKGVGVVTRQFAQALCSKRAVPILISSQTFYNYLEEIFQASGASVPRGDFGLSTLEGQWTIYKNKANNIYLFIPSDYYNAEMNKGYKDDMALGFVISKLTLVKWADLSPKNNTKNIGIDDVESQMAILRTIERHSKIPVKDWTDFFVRGTGDEFGIWNIYLDGHGTYPRGVDFMAKTAQEIDVSNAQIADFTIAEYRELMQFLIKEIKVNFLYITSCYAGDYNLILPYMTALINKKGNIVGGLEKPNFTIVTGSLTSEPVAAYSKRTAGCASESSLLGGVESGYLPNYSKFFELLHSYGSEASHRSILYNDEQLRGILSVVTPRVAAGTHLKQDAYGISALPQIMFPGTDTFRALALTDKISVIGDVLTKKHILENKSLELFDKEAILLYPRDIPLLMFISIRLGSKAPAIVSMQPGIGLHKIKTIESTDTTFKQFITQSLAATEPVFIKYYYIEKLILGWDESLPAELRGGRGYVTLNNVLIKQERGLIQSYFASAKKEFYLTYADIANIFRVHAFEHTIVTPVQFDTPFLKSVYDYVVTGGASTQAAFAFDELQKVLTPEEKKALDSVGTLPSSVSKELAPPPPPTSELLKDAIKAGNIREARVLIGKGIELSDEDLTELSDNDEYFKRLEELDLLPPPPPPAEEESKPLVVPEAPPLNLPAADVAPAVRPTQHSTKDVKTRERGK